MNQISLAEVPRGVPLRSEPEAVPRRRGRTRRGAALRSGTVIVVILLAWQLASNSGYLNPDFASSPSRVATALVGMLSTKSFWTEHLDATVQGFLAGWSLAVVVGVLLGLLMGLVGPIHDLLEPMVMGFYATPHVALIPLLIVWFGFGFQYKMAIVFIASIFWVLLNTIGAVREVDQNLIRMAQSFGASPAQVIATVILPGAMSPIAVGIRQSVPHGIIGAVIGEMFSSERGVGYLITKSAQLGLTDQLFALVILLGAAGAGTNTGLAAAHRRLERWRG